MARPIQPTPVLEGTDAKRLLEDLGAVCTPSEAKARIDAARRELSEMMRPKHDADRDKPPTT